MTKIPERAFPLYRPGYYTEGMTLRDYFAAHCDGIDADISPEYLSKMTGIEKPEGNYTTHPDEWISFWLKGEAKVKYMQADAMLAERQKGGDSGHS
jgi:hypothetical protein